MNLMVSIIISEKYCFRDELCVHKHWKGKDAACLSPDSGNRLYTIIIFIFGNFIDLYL